MKKYFKHYSASDLTTLLILIVGIVVLSLSDVGTTGKVASVLLYLAVATTILKGFILMWREKRHDRK